jgi:hypothetical protein
MKTSLFKYVIFFLFLSVQTINAQELIYNKSVTGVCYAGNKTSRIYVPPPEKFLKNDRSKGGSSITVYYTGFSEQAIKAFEYAVSILESILPAGTKTTVLATWEKIENSSVLGNSSISAFAAGWTIDAFMPVAFYPVALAEKIGGNDLNSDLNGDIIITLNSSANWYLGTDGNISANQYDLVTVVLHEMCHGLGFFDSMDADDRIGWYGISSVPVIYDLFIENLEERSLTDTLEFENYSADLLRELTGDKLYFKGPVLKELTGESRVKLNAPSTWDNGSSISHLDEDFSAYQPFKLMTPYIDKAEVIHDPGVFTLSILGDIGWINTRIIHDPPDDTENFISELQLSVEIRSDTTYNRDKVGLVYSFDGFENCDTVYMSSINSDDSFTALVNIPSYNKELQYFFFTEDFFLRVFHSPSWYQMMRYKVFIGSDTIMPKISHTPAEYYFQTVDSISINVEATDNIGIDSVYMEYRVNDSQSQFIGLIPDSKNRFGVVLSINDLSLAGGDSLQYRIFAKDSASVPNIQVAPNTGFYSVGIVKIGPVISGYSTDFTDAQDDFFNLGFEILRPIGFQKPGLHTKHPYESPEESGDSLNYIAMLRNPLRFDESGLLIEYSDIALVEPGEEGALFGSQDFYDYVIVEASKDFGISWFHLIDGYDARLNSTWLKTFNSSLVNQNSTATAKESMFVKQSDFITPSALLKAGDTILIRFRLFSDPYSWGWGWAIQDLKINPLIDGVEKNSFESLKIYPNPGKGIIKLTGRDGAISDGNPVRFEIFNTSGIPVTKGYTLVGYESVIDISSLPSGMYIIILYLNDCIRTFRYSLIK